MSSAIHTGLAGGRWQEFSLVEQLGNIGSEISRALKARALGIKEREVSAVERGLELFDLTLADPKHRGRTREICRAREVVCDFFFGDNEYGTDAESLDKYFLSYAIAARLGARPSQPLR